MVTDHNDGTYEVMFLAVEPGHYSAQVFLDFTLCDGFRDPPEDWYIKGSYVFCFLIRSFVAHAPLLVSEPLTLYNLCFHWTVVNTTSIVF